MGQRHRGRKLPNAPTAEEVEAMLDASRGWLNAAIALAVFAGLRQGEVRALEVRDVDLRAGIITIRRAFSEGEIVPPKSGSARRHFPTLGNWWETADPLIPQVSNTQR